jgi:uncharacterized protein involved in cysteine biosynthesis
MTVGLAIALVATVYFSIISPGFRKVVGAVIVAVIVLVLALVVWVMNRSDGQRNHELQAPTEFGSFRD